MTTQFLNHFYQILWYEVDLYWEFWDVIKGEIFYFLQMCEN